VPDLTLNRWLRLYGPLAFTFLLMSGSSPFVNKGIGRLPNEAAGLAAFGNAFVICIFLYSPLFAVRDAAQKFIRGRTSYRRTLVIHLIVGVVTTVPLLLVSRTALFDGPLLRSAMHLSPDLVPPVKRSILAFLPIPLLITLRGVHQAIHITNDTAKWVGIGTAFRFAALLLFLFGVGVPLRMEGPVMGGLAFAIGILAETVVVTVTARRGAAFLAVDHPALPPPRTAEIWGFSGPLFLANAMGVFMQPLTFSIVNAALLGEVSGASFNVVKSFTWFFCSTLFAMQAMSLARADSLTNVRRLLRYGLVPVSLFTGLILLVLVAPGARSALLHRFFEIDDPRVLEFVRATLPFTLPLPLVMAFRSAGRGLLMRGGKTALVSFASLLALGLLIALKLLMPTDAVENGAVIGFLVWVGALGLETAVLYLAIFRVGLTHCVTEGGRSSALTILPVRSRPRVTATRVSPLTGRPPGPPSGSGGYGG
jgi:hypothetical protein